MRSVVMKTCASCHGLLQKLLYNRHVVFPKEPVGRAWFDQDGYSLTFLDSDTGIFLNPWNSDSTNGHRLLFPALLAPGSK